MEAYLVAEGLFDEKIVEDGEFRSIDIFIQVVSQLVFILHILSKRENVHAFIQYSQYKNTLFVSLFSCFHEENSIPLD